MRTLRSFAFGVGALVVLLAYAEWKAGDAIGNALNIGVVVLATVIITVGIILSIIRVLTAINGYKAAKIEDAARAALAATEAAARARMLAAEAVQKERQAEIHAITAGNQVYLSDSSRTAIWRPMHLQPSFAIGDNTQPTQVELATWQLYHGPKKQAPLQLGQALQLPPVELPRSVNLLDLLPPDGATTDNIILGVSASNGQITTLAAPLGRLVHVGIGGSSGWGKSVFLQAIAYQLATVRNINVELALIDSELTTFSPFQAAAGLRYPVIDDEAEALRVVCDLGGEMRRRKALFFKHTPMPANLTDYNRQANDPLPFVCLMIDESTALFDNKDLEGALRPIILKARKYGIFALLGGQDWKAASLNTTIRNQFSTRVHFKALDEQQSRVLLRHPDAAAITEKGRGYAIIPGRELCEFQAPIIAPEMIIAALGNNAPPPTLPKIEPTPEEARVIEMFTQGAKKAVICRQLWGNVGGNQYKHLDAILAKFELL